MREFSLFLNTLMTQIAETLDLVKDRIHLSGIVNAMAAGELVTQGARASATMVLT